MKKKHCMLFGALMCIGVSGFSQEEKAETVREPLVHDPVMAKEGDTYYLYFTGWGISSMTTKNLKDWTFAREVFPVAPQWAKDSVPGYKGHTWAPDILYAGGKYHIFYSCSTFGKNTSAIGHAYRSTLSPDSAEPWTDTGAVITSREGGNYNAIDPNVVIDETGTPWMVFGSFWDGIQLVQLTKDMSSTCKPEKLYTVSSRRTDRPHASPGVRANAVEAPFIFKHDGYYYLFVSFDFCCRGKKSGDPFLYDITHPVPQASLLSVIRIKTICAMAVQINKARQNPVAVIVIIHRFFAIIINIYNFPVRNFNLRFNKLICKPNFSALNNHFPASFSKKQICSKIKSMLLTPCFLHKFIL